MILSALVITGCKGEKYKDYEEQRKIIAAKKLKESEIKLNEASFNLAITKDLLPIEEDSLNYAYFDTMTDETAKEHFENFNATVIKNPVKAAMYLTVATNPWVKSPEVLSTSAGAKYLNKNKNITSAIIPAELFNITGNHFQKLSATLTLNLAQAYIVNSGANFTKDPNFKLVVAALLFLKISEREVKQYSYYSSQKKPDTSSIVKFQLRSKRYLELALSIMKYLVTNNDSVSEYLDYSVAFVDFNNPDEEFKFDIFAEDSDFKMSDFVLVAQNVNHLLNGAFNNLGYVAINAENTSFVNVNYMNAIDVRKLNRDEILSTALQHLKNH